MFYRRPRQPQCSRVTRVVDIRSTKSGWWGSIASNIVVDITASDLCFMVLFRCILAFYDDLCTHLCLFCACTSLTVCNVSVCFKNIFCTFNTNPALCLSIITCQLIFTASRNSVCMSVCNTRALWKNKTMYCGCFDTTRKGKHSSFLTPTVVGEGPSLPCEICAQIDPPLRKMPTTDFRL